MSKYEEGFKKTEKKFYELMKNRPKWYEFRKRIEFKRELQSVKDDLYFYCLLCLTEQSGKI